MEISLTNSGVVKCAKREFVFAYKRFVSHKDIKVTRGPREFMIKAVLSVSASLITAAENYAFVLFF